jgi:hypothetical protein
MLENMQRAFDVIAARPGINSMQLCEALGVAKSTSANWIKHLCLCGSVERRYGKHIQRGSIADHFVVCGERPGIPPERHSSSYTPPEERIKRNFVKAKDCGMSADALALPREFFVPARVAA